MKLTKQHRKVSLAVLFTVFRCGHLSADVATSGMRIEMLLCLKWTSTDHKRPRPTTSNTSVISHQPSDSVYMRTYKSRRKPVFHQIDSPTEAFSFLSLCDERHASGPSPLVGVIHVPISWVAESSEARLLNVAAGVSLKQTATSRKGTEFMTFGSLSWSGYRICGLLLSVGTLGRSI